MKSALKALQRAVKSITAGQRALEDAIARLTALEASSAAMASCIVELRAFVEYCEKLPGRRPHSAFDHRITRARHALDKLQGEKQ